MAGGGGRSGRCLVRSQLLILRHHQECSDPSKLRRAQSCSANMIEKKPDVALSYMTEDGTSPPPLLHYRSAATSPFMMLSPANTVNKTSVCQS